MYQILEGAPAGFGWSINGGINLKVTLQSTGLHSGLVGEYHVLSYHRINGVNFLD